jgi:hypothetical protein
MAYRIYSGPRGSEEVRPMERDQRLYKEYSTLDEALAWADHVNREGGVALLIEGDDGTVMKKQEIAAALGHAERRAG